VVKSGLFEQPLIVASNRKETDAHMDNRINDINQIISNAIHVMEDSKVQIFEICESARQELQMLELELNTVIKDTAEIIDKADELERKYRLARIRLTEVSRDFVKYNEHDIKAAYEKATQIQIEKIVVAEKEQQLKARRDELQKRVKNVDLSIERAQTIHSQINVVLEYLSGDLNHVTRILESA
jgi:two-component system sensor histidine kinase DegS